MNTEVTQCRPSFLQKLKWRFHSTCENLLYRLRLRPRPKSNYVLYAEREFLAAGYRPIPDCDDDPERWVQQDVLELLQVFASQGHSGFSAQEHVDLFSKLALFKPLAPLSGDDSEWAEVMGDCWQNKRCSSVFKDADGSTYDINGRVFVEPSGCAYTSANSRVPVVFPYTPTTEYVEVPAHE